jgi:hypothetical protein
MRLPESAHTSRPWRIHELTPDFRLEDVWALPTPGGADDFPRLVEAIAGGDPAQGTSRAGRALWAIRWKLGEIFGWDDEREGVGSRVDTLRDRLPADMRAAGSGPEFESLPFKPLYQLDDEWAAEIANRTVHGVLPYMAAISPFRHLVVYPPVMQRIGREWHARVIRSG